MIYKKKKRILFDARIIRRALIGSLIKLNPLNQVRNPVMFVVEVVSILTTILFVRSLFVTGTESPWFILHISIWLWATVLFANFAESVAKGRGKGQAEALRASRRDVQAKKLKQPQRDAKTVTVPSSQLRKGDFVFVEAGDIIPGDGEVVVGVASVNESAITGESAPVIRERGGDRPEGDGGATDWSA